MSCRELSRHRGRGRRRERERVMVRGIVLGGGIATLAAAGMRGAKFTG